jgi:DNA-packaging protein gp3
MMESQEVKKDPRSKPGNKPGAPVGNQFYKLVKMPTGRPRKYTPAKLWKKANEYFDWASSNPLKEDKVFSTGKKKTLDRLRPFTETSFCLFAGIDENTFSRYKSAEEYRSLWPVACTISKIIYSQKFEGAAVDSFNANIIARELGLVDRQKLDIDLDKLTDDQLLKLWNHAMREAQKQTKA